MPTPELGHPAPRPRFGLRYTLIAALFLAGLAIGPGVVLVMLVKQVSGPDTAQVFDVPGELLFHADKPGAFVVWDQKTTTAPMHHQPHFPPNLSGVFVAISGEPSGAALPVMSRRGASYRMGNMERTAAFGFDAPQAGDYRVRVTGSFPPRLFAVAPDTIAQTTGAVLLGGCSGLVGVLLMVGSFVLLILTIIKHASVPRATAPGT